MRVDDFAQCPHGCTVYILYLARTAYEFCKAVFAHAQEQKRASASGQKARMTPRLRGNQRERRKLDGKPRG